jgi:hypothetical protein
MAVLGRSLSIACCRGEKITMCHDRPELTQSGGGPSTSFRLTMGPTECRARGTYDNETVR